MFSAKLTRAAHRATCNTTPHSTCAAAVVSTSSTASHTARPTSHARRHSSSKASSWPPDNSAGKPAPAAKSGVERDQPVSPPRAAPRQGKGRGRGYKRIAEVKKSAEPVDQFAGLPSVPVISGMRVEDLTLSKFFSLHRPVSITTTIPPPSSPEAFSSLFTKRQTQDPWANGNSAEQRPEDVIYTLHSLEPPEAGATSTEGDGLRWEVVHESPSHNGGNVTHLDGAARIPSIDELVARFRPFKAPPPPEPFPEENEKHVVVEKKASATRGRPKKKTYRATITVTESTDASGQKTYSASSTPIIRLPDANEAEDVTPASDRSMREPTRHRQPFLTRMRQRQRENASRAPRVASSPGAAIRRAPSPGRMGRIQRMYLISVKRQRKLKMKKHKYKRLMKRTRTLRRRLDRA